MDLVFELLDEPELRDGPVGRGRAAGLPARVAGAARAGARVGGGDRARRSRWSCGWSRAPTGTTRSSRPASTAGARRCSRTRPSATATSRRSRGGWCEARPHVRVAIASHNLRSVAHAIADWRASSAREDRDLELQVLRGLGDDLAAALADLGHRVRIYCPVGDLVAGMAYLVRRLLENTANESFLGEQERGAAHRGAAGRAVSTVTEPAPASATSRSWSCAARRRGSRSWRRCERSTRGCRSRCPSGSAASEAALTASSPPTPGSPTASSLTPVEQPSGTPLRRSRPPSAASATGAPAPPLSARRCCAAPPRSCASAGSSSRRYRCASARSRGRRPTPTSARRSTSSSTTRARRSRSSEGRALVQVPGERNTMHYAPRGVVAVDRALELPARHPVRHDGGRAGGRQRGGAEARRAVAGQRAGAGRARSMPPGSRATRCRSCPATARWAPRWCATRACT